MLQKIPFILSNVELIENDNYFLKDFPIIPTYKASFLKESCHFFLKIFQSIIRETAGISQVVYTFQVGERYVPFKWLFFRV